MTWLEYNDALQEVPADSEVIVGTGAQATWRLRRADLMPRHFIVTATRDGARIRPFSSDAVVSVNGRQLPCEATALEDGDVVSAGSGQFRFWAETPSESRGLLPVSVPPTAYLIETDRQPAVSLNRNSTGIGRDDSNALVLESVSSFEAEIRREAGGHALRVSSPSSVRVNGKLISAPVLLSEGDEIGIGDRVLRYTREPQPDLLPVSATALVSESLELAPREREEDPYSRFGSRPSAVALRNPMRAVAFVSSVIAAVAIATLLIMHRGP
jgi:predicted component of type VI protein secretion system